LIEHIDLNEEYNSSMFLGDIYHFTHQASSNFSKTNTSSKTISNNNSSSGNRKNINSLKRILIVEDDKFFANELGRSLKEAGYEVLDIAKNGLEAIDLANLCDPDLILMDIRMPKLDGIEAAKRINRNRECVIPVVLITANTDRDNVKKLKDAGILGYLVKPVHTEDVILALETAYRIAEDFNSMKNQVVDLLEQLKDRKKIERAKEILMKEKGIDGNEAMHIMQKASRRQNIKLKDLAEAIISSIDIIKDRKS